MFVLRVGTIPAALPRWMKCEHTHDAVEALEYLRLYNFDVLLIDDDARGRDVLGRARAKGVAKPAILLGAANADGRAAALNLGADDYISAPVEAIELHARMGAVVRRTARHTTSEIRRGPLVLDVTKRTLTLDGEHIHVPRREFAALAELMAHMGEPIGRERLLDVLYGTDDAIEMKSLDVVVCRLRKHLAAHGLARLVTTVWGVGYAVYPLK